MIMKYTVNRNLVKIESKGQCKYIELFVNNVIRIYTEKNPEDLCKLNKPKPLSYFDINLYEDADNPEIIVEYEDVSIRVSSELDITITRDDHAFFHETGTEDSSLKLTLDLSKDSRVFGLGDKMNTLDKKGYFYSSWNSDISTHHDELCPALYKTSNFLLTYSFKIFYGIYFNSTYRYDFDIAKTDLDSILVSSNKAKLDYYLFLSPLVPDIISNFSYLCGHPYLVRLKTLGNNQSRWSYENESEVLEVAKNFKKFSIPLDYIHLDIHYLNNYKILEIDKNRFPDMKGLADKLKYQGIELIAINDAAVKFEKGYALCDELLDKHLASSLDGKPYINTVWPGESIFPNYFSQITQEIIYKYMSKFIDDNGFSGIWNDMNEPASFQGELPLDVDMSFDSRILKHDEAHNLYGEKMAECSYRYFVNHHRRPYVFSRAGFATTPKYAFVWNGDNFSLWNHLRCSIPQSLSLGLSNFMFNGDDIGGFGGDTNKQLLIRWVEANLFFPFFRNHSSLNTKHQEPYAFDDETLNIYRKFVNLRYQFLPYLYNCCYLMSIEGQPITRPLFYHYQNDERTLDINDEYMVGSQLIVTPIINKDETSRLIYLPKGTWINFFTNETYEGEKEYIIHLPLDQLGLFVKKNSIIPFYPNCLHIDKKEIKTLIVRIYGEQASTEIYEDDGDSLDYLQAKFNIYQLDYYQGRFSLISKHLGYDTDYQKIKIITDSGEQIIPFAYHIDIKV